jgi:CHASE2 domain-containing sensor protein
VRELSLEGPRWAFALEVARVASGNVLEDDGRELQIGQRKIPTVGTSSRATVAGVQSESLRFLPIDYRGQITPGEKSPPFFAVSVVDLLAGKAGGQLQGKAVLIGFGSAEIGDRIPTPVSDRLPMPGVEIHANLIDAILAGRSLSPLNGWLNCGPAHTKSNYVLHKLDLGLDVRIFPQPSLSIGTALKRLTRVL